MTDELTRPTEEAAPPEAAPETPRAVFNPPIDIYETDEGLVLLADLPGVNQQGVELQVQDNRLTLFGRGKSSVPPEARVVYREYQEGDYLRSFILSDEVDHQRIRARLTNGVLEVVLPKAPRVQPRKIQVTTE
jgi:HSP20 family molecular chaperone IbpA